MGATRIICWGPPTGATGAPAASSERGILLRLGGCLPARLRFGKGDHARERGSQGSGRCALVYQRKGQRQSPALNVKESRLLQGASIVSPDLWALQFPRTKVWGNRAMPVSCRALV